MRNQIGKVGDVNPFLGISLQNSMKPGVRISFPFSAEGLEDVTRITEIFLGTSHRTPCFMYANHDGCRTIFHRTREASIHLSFSEVDCFPCKIV